MVAIRIQSLFMMDRLWNIFTWKMIWKSQGISYCWSVLSKCHAILLTLNDVFSVVIILSERMAREWEAQHRLTSEMQKRKI
jgi:hypothetical protein